MDEETIKKNLNRALSLVEDIDGKFQAYAFIVILHHLLESSRKSPDEITPDKSKMLKISLSEIFGKIKPSKYTDSAILIAYYHFKYEKLDKFNAPQIIELFDDVRAPKPSNINQILNSLIKRGFLRKSSTIDGKKGFEITKMGIEHVEELLKNIDK